MTRRQRVVNSLLHRESDIIPYHAGFTSQELEKLTAYTGDPDYLSGVGLHMAGIDYGGRPHPIPGQPDFYEDDFGVIWNRSGADKDIGVIDHPVIEDLEDFAYTCPVFDGDLFRREIEALLANREDRFTYVGLGFSVFERAWSLCGMENVLMGMLAYPDELDRLLDSICEFNLNVISVMLEYPEVDACYFGDDWGQQHGTIMGPDHWRRFIKPRLAKMYRKAKDGGKFIIQHSCGDIHELFPDLIDIGLDCYQTFQPEIYDIEAVKKEFGRHLTFFGGISTQQLLPSAPPEVVKSETIRIMHTMGPGGGYIASPTHAVPHDVPPENILAMLDVFTHQEQYL